ncbi:ABC transporter substrate-binding protein [Chitinivorax sp. B]|uniref:ABC transporter substrate-binding protein n=1 Tax=Chitinivorax sp. B TaxID=2502235 RepID=UPI0010F8D86E|nr:ABC transporter substrate-binding protein [Chitinivorax sp. B]
MKGFNTLAIAAAICAIPAAAWADIPAGYPASYQAVIDAAKKEGKLLIYSATDAAAAKPLIKDFEAMYPGVKIEYNDMNTTELYNRFISETAAGSTSADVLWSSAMDLQVKLVNDGFAMSYVTQESAAVPDWAEFQKQAYGTTYEPIGIVYNKRLLTPEEVPQTHADIIKVLKANPAKFQGKVTTYDIEKSGVGFTLLTQDFRVGGTGTWDLVKAMSGNGMKLQSSTGTMMERISSGENLIGYNIIGSYAHAKAQKDPSIGYVFPKDYTLVLSRVTFIAKNAKSPNAAKLWVDYLLSKRGQTILANQSDLFSIRHDVTGETTAAGLTKQLGTSLKPIPIGAGLLVYLDQAKRLDFLKQWQAAVKK